VSAIKVKDARATLIFFRRHNTCYDLNDLLELALKFVLVIAEFNPQRFNSLPHDLLSLLMLPNVVIDALVHGFLRL